MSEPDGTALGANFFVGAAERDAISLVRDATKQVLPKRFYKDATVVERDGAFDVQLDGRPVRTPRQRPLSMPTRAAAELVAAEWRAQVDTIDPSTMPLTRLVNAALDGVVDDIPATAAEIVKYAGSDLLCYRASEPPSLQAAQSAAWDPILDWTHDAFGARMALAEGIVFVTQSPAAIAAIRDAVDAIATGEHAALRIAALNVLTTLTGSALLALAIDAQASSPDSAWTAAHVDEDEQMRVWGFDAEALRRRTKRRDEFDAACALLASLR